MKHRRAVREGGMAAAKVKVARQAPRTTVANRCLPILFLLVIAWWCMTRHNQGNDVDQSSMVKKRYPWDSPPPISIPLFQTDHPVILHRHKCIAQIRMRQLTALQPLLPVSSSILLVDPAYHSNVGDLMITAGEHALLERLGWNTERYSFPANRSATPAPPPFPRYRECHYVQAGALVPHCADEIGAPPTATTAAALLHGGGNWGDLWPGVQRARIGWAFRALAAANYSVLVGMPQSLHYRRAETEARDARLFRRELSVGRERGGGGNGSRVVLFWREQESYRRAQTLYPFVENRVLPDISFQVGPYQRMDLPPQVERVDFLWLLRRDHESTLFTQREATDNDDDEENDNSKTTPARAATVDIPQLLWSEVEGAIRRGAPTRSFRVVDWPDRWILFDNTDPYFTETAIQLLSLGRVVICDRLHAAILAFLAGIPFVYLDQSTGKISKCLRVAMETCGVVVDIEEGFGEGTTAESLWFSRAANLNDAVAKGEQMLGRVQ